jgi:hypothetical protein
LRKFAQKSKSKIYKSMQRLQNIEQKLISSASNLNSKQLQIERQVDSLIEANDELIRLLKARKEAERILRIKISSLEESIQSLSLENESLKSKEEGRCEEKIQYPECVVCYDKIADHVILDCMHVSLCEDCIENITNNQCPQCRGPVKEKRKIYYP